MNVMASHFPAQRTALAGGMTGEVLLRAGAGIVIVEAGASRLQARCALSCLVEPEPGDTVLIGGDAERPFVLAVLERRGTAPLRLTLAGDAQIQAVGGTLSLSGDEGLAVASPKRLDLSAPEVSVIGRTARLVIDEVAHVGRSLSAHVGRLKVVGEMLETAMERIMTRARHSFRFVAATDHLRSGEIDHRAEGSLHLHATNTILSASTVAKVDAGQIHLG